MKRRHFVWTLVVLILALSSHSYAQAPLLINYQGRLLDGTNLVNGPVEMSLRLFNVNIGGSPLFVDSNMVFVVDGLYSTFIGDDPVGGSLPIPDVLTNAEVFIEVIVDTTVLLPREQLVSVGYALMTRGVIPNGITGDMLDINAVTEPKIDNNAVTSDKIADGTVTNQDLSADAVTSDKIANGTIQAGDIDLATFETTFWQTDGNAGITPGVHYLGTSDGEPLELRVNGVRVAEFVKVDSGYTFLLGGADNFVATNAGWSSVVGGNRNGISNLSVYAFIGGGDENRILQDSKYCVIAGGSGNVIHDYSYYNTISGGRENDILGDNDYSIIVGGNANRIETNSDGCIIVGGSEQLHWF